MKVVHVIASIDPKNGGLQAVAMRIAAAQSALGIEVHVVSYGGPSVVMQVQAIGEGIPHFFDIHWHLMPEPGKIEQFFCLEGRRMLREVFKGATFVHIHGVWEPFLVHASKIARMNGIPYCVCPAGMLDHWSLAQKSWKKRIALRVCYRKMLNGAAFLHVLNVDEVSAIEPLELKSPKLVIPNGIFPEEFDPLPTTGLFKQKLPFSQDRRYILFLSRLHIKKGLDILAMAFATICDTYPDVDLVVAGPDGGAEDDFDSLVRTFGIGSRVHLTGPIYGDSKIEAMVDADCFCLPSRQEGFSMAITEALACGTPVVITDQCHFPEVAEMEAGIIVPVDPIEVAQALATILSDAVRAKGMGENGRRLVFERFTWPEIAYATVRGYSLTA